MRALALQRSQYLMGTLLRLLAQPYLSTVRIPEACEGRRESVESSGMEAQTGGRSRMRGQKKEEGHLGRLKRCSGVSPEHNLPWRGGQAMTPAQFMTACSQRPPLYHIQP